MTKKVVTACSIFGIMFGSAWFVHEHTKRTYSSGLENSSVPNIVQTMDTAITNSLVNENAFEPFSPREYIRVMSQQ